MAKIEHKTAGLAGVRVHYVRAGHGPPGPTILLIHGLGSSWLTWRENIQPLVQAGYTVIALDLPGHGDSDNTPDLDYHPAGGAELVYEFLDILGSSDLPLPSAYLSEATKIPIL